MLFKSLIIASLSAIGLVVAEEQAKCPVKCPSSSSSSSLSCNTKLCTKELEQIVYQPMNPTLAYLNKISEELKIGSPIFWSPQNESFIESFEIKYRVGVQVFDAFRNRIYPEYFITKTFSVVQKFDTYKSYYSTTSTANMNGSGFAIFSAAEMERIIPETDLPIPFGMGAAMYEFLIYNNFGEVKYVNIVLPLSEAPLIVK